jgi:hypothetical protein
MQGRSIRFAEVARQLSQAARLRGLEVPSYRSPPKLAGIHRTIRRRGPNAAVAISLRDRPWSAVLADMIEGVVVTNRLDGAKADRARAALWLAVDTSDQQAA